MNPIEELNLAKQIIADQQIHLARLLGQIRMSFVHDPEGKLVHTLCGKALIIKEDEIIPGCECFTK